MDGRRKPRAEWHRKAGRTLTCGLAGFGEKDALRQGGVGQIVRSWSSIELCAESGKSSRQTARTDLFSATLTSRTPDSLRLFPKSVRQPIQLAPVHNRPKALVHGVAKVGVALGLAVAVEDRVSSPLDLSSLVASTIAVASFG